MKERSDWLNEQPEMNISVRLMFDKYLVGEDGDVDRYMGITHGSAYGDFINAASEVLLGVAEPGRQQLRLPNEAEFVLTGNGELAIFATVALPGLAPREVEIEVLSRLWPGSSEVQPLTGVSVS